MKALRHSLFPSIATTALAFTLSVSSHGQTLRTWTGGTGDFTVPTNWNPQGVPEKSDEVVIPTGSASFSGDLARAAATTIHQNGSLTINGRFTNAQDGPAPVLLEGNLTTTGTWFIVGNNAEGSITQTSGNLTANVTEGWYLSDITAGSRGSYLLTGGEMNVTLSGGSDLGQQIHIGKQPGSDLFRIDGGTANFQATSGNRRFYVSRNGTLQIDSGTLDVEGFRFFLIGREASGWNNSRLVMNGGVLRTSGFPGDGAFIVGAANAGVFFLNDGEVSIASAPIWLGDGSGAGAIVQSGGSISANGEMLLGRGNNSVGEYFMKGGELTVGSIPLPPNTNSHFFFQGGKITLNGDQRAIVDEPWFVETGNVTSSYDATSNTTLLEAAPVEGHEKIFRYYRFSATRLRNIFGSAVQLSEFEFLRDGQTVSSSNLVVTNPGGNSPAAEGVANLVDGNPATKWLDSANQPVVFDFGIPVTIDGYRFTTGNDALDRDPLRWLFEGSHDGVTWTALDRTMGDYLTPRGRRIPTLDLPLPEQAPDELEILSLEWTGNTNAAWDTTSSNWIGDSLPRNWSNEAEFEAIFAAAGPKAVTLPQPVKATGLTFTASGYTLSGSAALELLVPARIDTRQSAEIAVPVIGAHGLNKTGEGNLTFLANTTHTGSTVLNGGTVTYTGSASSPGNGTLSMAEETGSRAVLRIEGTGTLNYSGSARIGVGNDASAAVYQSGGTVNVGGPGVEYLQIGGGISSTSASHGSWHLSGGHLNTGGGGSESGIRVGDNGQGSFLQTGGTLNAARWFAIGGSGGGSGEGVATFTGGQATVASGFRFLLGDRTGATGTLNIGTLAGGEAVVTTLNGSGLALGSNGDAGSAMLNLNSGTLVLGGPLHRSEGPVRGVANFNGGTLRAGGTDVLLNNGSLSWEILQKGGLIIDTAGNNATYRGNLIDPYEHSLHPAGGIINVPDGGSGYIGTPLVGIQTNGFGPAAIAEVENGSIARIILTSPGEDFQVGKTLAFTFYGGGATVPAPPFEYTVKAEDLPENSAGPLVKTGEGRLTLEGTAEYTGETRVQQGILEINTILGETEIIVSPGATLQGGFETSGPVTVRGEFSPGSGIGTATGAGALTLAAASVLEIDLSSWNAGPGVGYDSATFQSLAIQGSPTEKFIVRLDSTALENFAETAREMVLVKSGSITGLTSSNWRVAAPGFPGFGSWNLVAREGDLILAYTPGNAPEGSYESWLAGFPALTDTTPGGDPDGDGIPNLLEYVLNGDPTSPSRHILPEAQIAGRDLVFTFIRRSGSEADTRQIFQYGSDLAGWIDLPISPSGQVEITPNSPDVGVDKIVVTLPADEAREGRIFGRLVVTHD